MHSCVLYIPWQFYSENETSDKFRWVLSFPVISWLQESMLIAKTVQTVAEYLTYLCSWGFLYIRYLKSSCPCLSKMTEEVSAYSNIIVTSCSCTYCKFTIRHVTNDCSLATKTVGLLICSSGLNHILTWRIKSSGMWCHVLW